MVALSIVRYCKSQRADKNSNLRLLYNFVWLTDRDIPYLDDCSYSVKLKISRHCQDHRMRDVAPTGAGRFATFSRAREGWNSSQAAVKNIPKSLGTHPN